VCACHKCVMGRLAAMNEARAAYWKKYATHDPFGVPRPAGFVPPVGIAR